MIRKAFLLVLVLTATLGFSQTKVILDDLDLFDVGKNWKIVGEVSADFENDGVLNVEKGEGILANLPTEKRKSNLLTNFQHGDIDISLEFMMAQHSNSGIYLQGRYEVQLLDSWGVQNPRYSDCGGIYQRRRSDGSQFEGHAPLINACKAPGTWQKMEISFRAPRFDADGNKTDNAKIISIHLNGYPIHENIELTGPTGGPISEEEATMGPLMIQGDHGAVAFRNIEYTLFDGVPPTLSNINYTYYEGDNNQVKSFNFDELQMIENAGTSYLDLSMVSKEDGWAIVYEGDIEIQDSNIYTFHLQAGGQGQVFINDEEVVSKAWTRTFWDPREGNPIKLEKGMHSFKVIYGKTDGWLKNGLGLFVTSENLRLTALHQGLKKPLSSAPSPILANAEKTEVIRSFTYIDDEILTRAISIGSPTNLHYTYNLENGALVRVWKGDFLDLTPMLNGRGNATSVPRGAVLDLGNKPNAMGEKFRSYGYDIDKDGIPIFRYSIDDSQITDKIVSKEGKDLTRTVIVEGSLDFSILPNASIVKISDDLYEINDKSFFIRIDQGAEQVGFSNNKLTARISDSTLKYSILW